MEATMRIVRVVLVAALGVAALVYLRLPAQIAQAVKADPAPQELLDQGLAFEASWLAFKAGRGDQTKAPNPFDFERIDRALGEVPQSWDRAGEAVALIERMRAARPEMEKAWWKVENARRAKAQVVREKELLQQRRDYPKSAEANFLDAGQDVYITAEGKDLRTLKVRYILMGRPLAHQIGKNDKLLETWRRLGFHKVELTDGYRAGWTLNLK
jgi:hypothetical protein